jgi:hypothetical protein
MFRPTAKNLFHASGDCASMCLADKIELDLAPADS